MTRWIRLLAAPLLACAALVVLWLWLTQTNEQAKLLKEAGRGVECANNREYSKLARFLDDDFVAEANARFGGLGMIWRGAMLLDHQDGAAYGPVRLTRWEPESGAAETRVLRSGPNRGEITVIWRKTPKGWRVSADTFNKNDIANPDNFLQ